MKLLKITFVSVALLATDTALALSGSAVKPPTPVLISPANGAVNQSLTTIVRWQTSRPGESYRVQVATHASFASTVVNQGGITNTTSYTLSGLPANTTLYWRINASKNGQTSNWSSTRNFTTTGGPVISPPAPIQIFPPNGIADHNVNTYVAWQTSRPGELYRVQVATNAGFTSTLVNASVTAGATGYTLLDLAKNTTFYWRVNATKDGQTSDWSPTWNFTTTNAAVPGVPTLSSPANGAVGVSPEVTFSWNAVEGATGYDLMVAGEPTFNGGAHIQWYGYPGTSLSPGSWALLEPCIDHQYWRVRGRNAAGYGAWSEVWDFTLDPFALLSVSSSERSSSARSRFSNQLSKTDQDPNELTLHQNYPNPFHHTTVIEFTVPKDQHATLKVLDVMGREVEKLFDAKGDGTRQQVIFDGDRLPAGAYFSRLTIVDGGVIVRRMSISK